jgi:3-oxoacyl-[acyl-carrier-protein] synthase I
VREREVHVAEDAGIVVTGAGVLTSLGQVSQSWAAMRAGLARIEEREDFHLLGPDEEFDLPSGLRGAQAPLPWGHEHPWDRLAELALPALDEALERAGLTRRDWSQVHLSLSLRAPAAPATAAEMGRYVLDAMYADGGLPTPRAAAVRFEGHAAGAVAMVDAVRALRAGERDCCVVGGADTFLDPEAIAALDLGFRLRSERSADGYLPGEAAAFVVLETAAHAAGRGAKPLATVAGYGLGDEPRPLGSDEPCAAAGLCDAIRQTAERAARGGGRQAPAAWVMSDQNGERHRAKEWALAVTRLHELLDPGLELWRPAESFGDTGPASVPLLAAMAAETLLRGAAPARDVLLVASSDGPARAGVLLRGRGGKD